jgi:hypothetical protein
MRSKEVHQLGNAFRAMAPHNTVSLSGQMSAYLLGKMATNEGSSVDGKAQKQGRDGWWEFVWVTWGVAVVFVFMNEFVYMYVYVFCVMHA